MHYTGTVDKHPEDSVLLDDEMGRVWIYSPLSSSPQRSIAMDDGQPLLDVAAPRSTATRRPPRAKKIIKKVLPVLRRRYRKLRAAEPVPYEQLVNSPSTSPEKKLDKAEKEEKNKMEQQQPIKENTSLTPEKQAKKKDKVKQKDAKKKEKINKQNEDPDFNTGPGPSSRKDTQSRRNKILEGVLGFFTHKIKKHKYTSNVSKNISKVAEKSSIPQPARTSQAPSSNLEVPSPVKICGHSRRTILKRTSPLDKFRPLDALANGLTLLNERDKIGAEFELVMQKEIKSIRKFLKLPPEELPIVDTNISLCHDNERASTSTRPEISNNTAHTSEMSTQTQIYLVENETSNFDVGDASIFCSQLKLVWISKKTKTGIQEEAPGTSATRSTSDLSPLSPGPDEDDKQNDQGAGSCSLDPFSGGSSRTAPDGYRRVQFDQDDDDTTDSEEASGNSRYYDRHLHYKSRKYSLQEGPRFGGMSGSGERRVSVAPGEETLPEVDLDDLATHRTDDPHVGRHKTDKPSTVHVTRKDGGDKLQNILSEGTYKKIYDHSPHSVFVQLDELLCNPEGESEWQERARWIKYEEDREEGSDRWGKPHVASLSFHSLLNLRRCLETGVVLLDLDEKDLPGVAYRVVENMVSSQLIEEDDKPVVMRSLLLRHRHVHEDKGFRFSISGRKHASYTSLQNLSERRRRSSHALPTERKKSSSAAMDMKEVEYLASTIIDGSQDELRKGHNESIMKRIPEDSEATTVLVGAVGFLEQPTIAFVRLAQGILMPSITEVPIPVRFMFILLGPSDADLDYHEVGRSISTLMSNPSFHSIAYKADDRRELLSGINEFLDDSIVLPPGDWERQALLPFDELKAKSDQIRKRKRDAIEKKRAASITEKSPSDEKKALLEAEKGSPPPKEPDDPLSRSGRLFGGVIRDIKRRYPFYVSDFTDALNGQCAAATIFMYFAALSSAITFGGLLAEKTHGQIGISETLVFTCAGGIIFALLAGQPMMITGATGPLLLLDDALSSFCRSYGFDFLAARMYCGLWMIVIALAVASIEGSVAVKKITRFTEDIFAFLISLIFIGEPITNIISVYRNHPLGVDYCAFQNQTLNDTVPEVNGTLGNTTSVMMTPQLPILPRPNTALFCTILTLSTFIIAYYLRIFRNGKFLGRSARRALGDFGVPIAIVLMVGVSSLVPVWTETLRVPAGLSPTAARSWLVPLNPGLETIPFWAMLVMALPALMVYIIVFMETHIAELIIDKPERRLKKGSGFHMDIVIMSLVNGVCGMFGAPWQCVATVRSVSHVSALTVMSTTHAPGDKPHIVEVKEQRLTGLLVAFLCGISVLAAGWLRLVPMAVLFGVFLYMGISALGGIQFWDRCILLLKPVKHHPQVPYVRRVPTLKMHMYTLIQLAGICILYAVKSSRFSLALPFFLVMMVPLRMSLVYLFTPLQLRALDGAQKEIDKDDEPDFYEEAPLP